MQVVATRFPTHSRRNNLWIYCARDLLFSLSSASFLLFCSKFVSHSFDFSFSYVLRSGLSVSHCGNCLYFVLVLEMKVNFPNLVGAPTRMTNIRLVDGSHLKLYRFPQCSNSSIIHSYLDLSDGSSSSSTIRSVT